MPVEENLSKTNLSEMTEKYSEPVSRSLCQRLSFTSGEIDEVDLARYVVFVIFSFNVVHLG